MNHLPVSPAQILSRKSHVVPGACKITELFFNVPRDYANPARGTLRLFARSASRHDVPVSPTRKKDKEQPAWLVYLQGGPGFGCGPPQSLPYTRSFLDKGYTLLFLDQRGTGLSEAISASALGLRGDDEKQLEHLTLFRADNIVRDAEAIRLALTSDAEDGEAKKWSLIGQSFGGFCITTYLSLFPDSLREAFVTGGLPPVHLTHADEVYRRTFRKVKERNEKFYEKYPEDVERVKVILRFLGRFGETVRLPSEGLLSVRRFLTLGIILGFHGECGKLCFTRHRTDSSQAVLIHCMVSPCSYLVICLTCK